MTTEVLAASLTAGQQYTFGQGRIWYVKSATSPITITAEQAGTGSKIRKFINVAAGFKFTADAGDGWTYLRVISALSQNVELVIGDDDVEVSNAVTVNGSVTTIESPATLVTDAAPVVCPTAALTAIVPINGTRRRVSLSADALNTGTVYVRTAGGANNLYPLAPGLSVEFDGTYAMSVRNDTGANATIYIFEES